MYDFSKGMPARRSVFSLAPVMARVRSKTPTTAVPCEPRKWASRPQITSAAMRPWRLAGPASGIKAGWPVTKSRTSTASPTAKIGRVAGAHLVVDADAAGRAEFQPGLAGQPRVGPDAHAEDHQPGDDPLAAPGDYRDRIVGPRLERGHRLAQPQIDPLPAQFLVDGGDHLGVHRRHDLVGEFQQRHVERPPD